MTAQAKRGDARRTARITRRRYLTIKALATGCGPLMASEAVSSVAIEHPEWDMDEKRTFEEWEAGS